MTRATDKDIKELRERLYMQNLKYVVENVLVKGDDRINALRVALKLRTPIKQVDIDKLKI